MFTSVPLQGNALAVFLDGGGLGTDVMQRTARELNLSETVFVLPAEDAQADARLRIFTPRAELPFAGHPVLGTAVVVAEEHDTETIRLQTGAGVIPVALRHERDRVWFGEMDQPVPERVDVAREAQVIAALGLESSARPLAAYRNGPLFVYVELESEGALAALRPDINRLADLGELGVTCFAGAPPQVRMRMFAPALGVPEDPATGSAAGPLAVHLLRTGRLDSGQRLEIRQGEEIARPSTIHVRVHAAGERIERVLVGGAVVVVARGEYRLG